MGSSTAPQVQPAVADPAAVAQEQAANNADLQQIQSSLSTQTASLQRQYGAQATGGLNGMSSIALTPLGAVTGMR